MNKKLITGRLMGSTAECFQCAWSTDHLLYAEVLAKKHIEENPGHECELSLHYHMAERKS